MKGTFFAAVAAMASLGAAHNHRQVHQLIKKDGLAATGVAAPTGEVCVPGCTTVWKTITGEMTRMSPQIPTLHDDHGLRSRFHAETALHLRSRDLPSMPISKQSRGVQITVAQSLVVNL